MKRYANDKINGKININGKSNSKSNGLNAEGRRRSGPGGQLR